VAGGGKIIAMGDGMPSLYMTSWEGVNNYQCATFMHDVIAWLLN
jgi:predicted RNA-binding protein with PUA-like domain